MTGDTGLLIDLGTGSTTYNHSINPNDILKVRYINGTMSVYWNNDFIVSREVSVTGKMGYYTNTGRVQKIKNIKLKPL